MVRSSSRALGVVPLQSLHILPAARSSRTGSGSLEVLRPFDDVTRTSPRLQRSVRPAAVPLSGFLDLSAVSWHVRASRPCFMPLPPVGFTLQSFVPRWDRVRLSASLAPLQFSTAVPEVRCARSRPPGFTDARAFGAVAWSPPGARTPFPSFSPSRCRARSARLRTLSRTGRRRLPRRPGAHAPESPRSGGFGCFEAFLPPRVRARGALLSQPRRGRCSPGSCLSRALIRSSLGPSHDPADHSVRRGLVTAVAKGATPRRQVRPDDLAAATTSSASDPQGDCRPARAASRRQSCLPRPWSRQMNRRLVVLGGVKISTSSRLRETGVLS